MWLASVVRYIYFKYLSTRYGASAIPLMLFNRFLRDKLVSNSLFFLYNIAALQENISLLYFCYFNQKKINTNILYTELITEL